MFLVPKRELQRELHCDERDEPTWHAMIDLHGELRSLGASGCCKPVLDRCDELRPESPFLRIGECTGGTCSGGTARCITALNSALSSQKPTSSSAYYSSGRAVTYKCSALHM
jgi:hypothetical protein